LLQTMLAVAYLLASSDPVAESVSLG